MKRYAIEALFVAAGSVLGGSARVVIQLGGKATIPWSLLPWVTVLINILACAVIGVVIAHQRKNLIAEQVNNRSGLWTLFWGIGFCGGFSTFSLFTLDWLSVGLGGESWGGALLYLALSFVLGGLAFGFGYRRASAAPRV